VLATGAPDPGVTQIEIVLEERARWVRIAVRTGEAVVDGASSLPLSAAGRRRSASGSRLTGRGFVDHDFVTARTAAAASTRPLPEPHPALGQLVASGRSSEAEASPLLAAS
jgi:hypothetical protein